jgi:kumamolisin
VNYNLHNNLARPATVVALLLAATAVQAQGVSTPTGGFPKPAMPDMAFRPGDSMVGGQVVIPKSSEVIPGDAGVRARTHIRVFAPYRGAQAQPGIPGTGVGPLTQPAAPQPVAGSFAETPASLACVYGLAPFTSGCDAHVLTTNASGGSRAVAVVDAYDNPTALADLQAYSAQFGLPAPNLTVIYATGVQPAGNTGWGLEAALDVDMVHAMAPNAQIFLVEAASNSNADLLAAEGVATFYVNGAGGGEISNSWGESEFSTESNYDSSFVGGGIVYLASTGDTPGTE